MILKDYFQKKRVKNVLSSTLAIIGTLWLVLEISSYCIPEIQKGYIIPLGFWFLIILITASLIISIILFRPIVQITEKINNRDITISIIIGNFFQQEGDLIIGTNTTFDTDLNEIISEKSIQGQFTKNNFKNKTADLEELIDKNLKPCDDYVILDNKPGKNKKYPIGKTITIRSNGITAYFLALADINENGVASSSFENIILSLSNLWSYISINGGTEPLVIPVLGTGFSRIEVKKELIIQEIIKSFIAACSEKRFTEKLTIVIYKPDYEKTDLDLNKLHDFLKCQCRYAEFKQNLNQKYGTGIDR